MKRLSEHPCMAAIVAMLIALVVFSGLGWAYLHYQKSSKLKIGNNLAQDFALRISQRTNESVSPVYMLASLVKQNNGSLPEFEKLALELIDEFPLVRALELAPAGVVRQVYPLHGNEAIVGHDLLKDRERNRDAHVALAKRQMLLAGPFELIQGGLGAVARYPVFLSGSQGKNTFWGFTIVVIRVDQLLLSAGQMDLERKEFDFEICRVMRDSEGEGCKAFARSSTADLEQPVTVMVELPNNQWRLSVSPVGGWISNAELLAICALVIAGALLVGLFQYFRMQRAFSSSHEQLHSGSF